MAQELIPSEEEKGNTGNVIFIHPDGAGLNTWNAFRVFKVGPDGEINWDKIPKIGIYRGHMKDGLTSTSNGGATTHAFGVKVKANSYGMNGKKYIRSLSGYHGSIMKEAIGTGKSAGVINTGHIAEPGTGVFLSSSPTRHNYDRISKEIITSGAQVIMSGGEKYLLPSGKKGFHGNGSRQDDLDLIEYALEKGYTVVYTKKQLEKVNLEKTDKLLGVFAHDNTYNDLTEEDLQKNRLPMYNKEAPAFEQMVSAALKILSRNSQGFILVAEEEGSDNFGNKNNASGVMEALGRADAGYAVALKFINENPKTLLITASDSDAGGLQVYSPADSSFNTLHGYNQLDSRTDNGAPLDGRAGRRSLPFESAPDRREEQFYYGMAFAAYSDLSGGIIARAAGLNSERLPLTVDNTDIYRMMYLTLFGKDLGLKSTPSGMPSE
ncbi:MAG: alkaline phosphatase [Candidatus Omnitrophota bacterium]